VTHITNLLIGLIALLHFYFLVLEMFYWTKPKGLKTFNLTLEFAQASAVLAANQGLYNGFLSAGLIWSLLHPNLEVAFQLQLFFLICVLAAGIYGGYSANRRIYFIQALPSAVGLVLLTLNDFMLL
jgi:putative membrane protein